MKRVCGFAFVFALIFALGVSPAFAAEHTFPAHGVAKLAARPAQGALNLHSLGSFVPVVPRAPLSAGFGGIRPLLAGGNISTAGELPFPEDASGTVDAAGVAHNVYWFYLEAGGEIDFHLSATPGSQTELQIFDPYATDVNTSPTLLQDMTHAFPTTDAFVAQYNGYYYVDVYAKSGASSYTLPYDLYMADSDDIPGTPVTASPIVRWADADWNWDDVSRLALRAGDTLTMHVGTFSDQTHTNDFDMDLYLYGPSASSVTPHTVAGNPGLVAYSALAGNDDTITYPVTVAGTYYMDTAAYSGRGADTLTWSVTPVRPSITRAPSASRLSYKRKKGQVKFNLSARFTDQFSLPINGVRVYLQWSANGKTKWKNKIGLTTGANGVAGAKITAKKKATVYFRWYRPATSTSKAAYSGAQRVTIK